jgi:hypothetical protein
MFRIRSFIGSFPLLVVVVLALGLSLADPFESTRWKIKAVPDDEARQAKAKEFDDVISFKGSQFSSEYLGKLGFKPAPYEEDTRRFGPANFSAEQTSQAEGKVHWSGTVTAATINGQLKWTRKDGTELNYTFQGERLQN